MAVKDPDHVAERLSWTSELIGLGTELGEPETAFSGHLLRHDDLLGLGHLDAAHADLDAAEQLVTDLHQPFYLWRVAIRRAGQAMLAGRLSEAEDMILSASGKREGAVPAGYAMSVEALQLFALRYDQGDLGELEETSARRIEALPGSSATWRALLALIYCETGRPAEARSHFERSIANLAEIPRDSLWFFPMTALASVAVDVGDRGCSATLYERLAPYSGRTGGGVGFMTFGIVDLSLGALAATLLRFEDSERHFAASADLCRRLNAPTWLARTQLEWARMLSSRAEPLDVERAHDLLCQALATARELGLANVERGAVELLSAE
jgi:tetratricopeptide (TPR) repeat protein